MDKLIDAWHESTGQKYEYQIPESWIVAGLVPGLTATEPAAPEPSVPGDPIETPTPEEV